MHHACVQIHVERFVHACACICSYVHGCSTRRRMRGYIPVDTTSRLALWNRRLHETSLRIALWKFRQIRWLTQISQFWHWHWFWKGPSRSCSSSSSSGRVAWPLDSAEQIAQQLLAGREKHWGARVKTKPFLVKLGFKYTCLIMFICLGFFPSSS